MMLWRMKLRNAKETTVELWTAFWKDPLGSLRFMFQLPLLLLVGWLTRSPQGPPDAATMARQAEEENQFLVFQRQIDQLPPHLQNFSEYFGVPKFSDKEVKEILSTSLAKKMIRDCPHMRKLIPYDLFPIHFWHVIHDIPMYFEQMVTTKVIYKDSRITLERNKKCVAVSFPSAWNAPDSINIYLEWELRRDGGDPRIHEAMWYWLFDLLIERPYILEGFEAQKEGAYLVLVRTRDISLPAPLADMAEHERLNKLRWETPRRPPVVHN